MNFLIVDDNAKDTELYKAAADMVGVGVTVVHNAYDALKALGEKNYQYDAAILDLNMEYIDGLNLSDNIRLNERKYRDSLLPLFFYTGYQTNDAILKVKERNKVSGIFTKSLHTPDQVFETVKGWMRKPQTAQKGSSSVVWTICLVAVIAEIVTASIFLWLLNRQDVSAAYRYSEMRNQRDQYKKICESNLLLASQKEKWIEQQDLQLPAQLSGQTPCAATENREK